MFQCYMGTVKRAINYLMPELLHKNNLIIFSKWVYSEVKQVFGQYITELITICKAHNISAE